MPARTSAEPAWRLGIDLGGSKIEAVLLYQGRLVQRRRVATPQGDYAATLTAIGDLVQEMEQAAGCPAVPGSVVGIGHPGSLDPRSGRLRNANSTCLNGQPFAQDIARRLARPVRLANDANCLALSESRDGAAAGARSAFVVILGTGVGGALLHQGALHTGHNALAGEWGHNPLPWRQDTDPLWDCWCGQRGCLETVLSGPALARDHAAHGGAAGDAVSIAAAAARGDAVAAASIERYADRLARALAAVVNFFDPERIVLAGGVSQIESLYSLVPARWTRWVFAAQVDTRLLPAQHGDASGVFGAAYLGE